jgi:serpin B
MAEHLFSKNSNKNNIVFSPISIQFILSIIASGSEGPTQQQLLDFLHFESIDHLNSFSSQLVSVILKDAAPAGGPRLSFTNGVWVEKTLSLQASFEQIVSSDYEATLASVDFKTKVFILCISPSIENYTNKNLISSIKLLVKKIQLIYLEKQNLFATYIVYIL